MQSTYKNLLAARTFPMRAREKRSLGWCSTSRRILQNIKNKVPTQEVGMQQNKQHNNNTHSGGGGSAEHIMPALPQCFSFSFDTSNSWCTTSQLIIREP